MRLSVYDQSDLEEIERLFAKVFADSEGEAEGSLIGKLVSDMAVNTDAQDIYGFSATERNQIVGCVFFTKLTFENDVNALLLSPAAIHTDYQRKGIGQKLIKFGIDHLTVAGVKLVFTYGDPDFYSKVGFKCISENLAKAPLKMTRPEGWLGQSLAGGEITPIPGNSHCVAALNNPEYW
jgi:putative acetyltransferase